MKNTSEQTLSFIANFILTVGLIAGAILFFVGISQFGETRDVWGRVQETTGWAQLLLSAYVILISVTAWALLSVLVNISNSLKEINKKTEVNHTNQEE